MAQTAVAESVMVAPFAGYRVPEGLATAVTDVPTGGASAGDASNMRRARPNAHAADAWEYLAEGCAWVLDACD